MINQDSGCFLEGILRMNGTISSNFESKTFIVGFLLNTIVFYLVLYITDGCINRINWQHIDFIAINAVFIRNHITSTFVDSKVNLHLCFGINMTDYQVWI